MGDGEGKKWAQSSPPPSGDVSGIVRFIAWVKFIGSLIFSFVYVLESLFMALLPRSFKRKSVKDQIILITGGGSGIGRLMAIRFAKKGAKIITWDVNEAGNQVTVKEVRSVQGECYAYTVDLCDRHAIYKAAERVKSEVGKVDILINNAGIVTGKNFQESPDELIQKTFDVNIMSHFWTTKAFMPDMMRDNKGHLVTISSLAGLSGVNKLADYCASKFATVGFDESLKLELMVAGYNNVHTTVVCPYYVKTGMFDGVQSQLIPLLDPEYVADEIVDGILMKSHRVMVPWYINSLIFLKAILPMKALIIVYTAIGGPTAMSKFKGRLRNDKRYAGV